MKFVKILENGWLEYAPKNIEGISNWINDEQAVRQAGFLPLVEEATPEGRYISGYEEKDGEIHAVFSLLPEPTYVEKRMSEYPSLSDQLDMIYWDKINGTNLWQEKITEIKTKYPKPEAEVIASKASKSAIEKENTSVEVITPLSTKKSRKSTVTL